MKRRWTVALAVMALLCAAPAARAFVPQTIAIDGVNDFDPSNLLDDDRGDTEIKDWCTNDPEVEGPMDLGRIYVTNDNNYIYFGFEYANDCFNSPQPNLGIAIDLNGASGGTTDPFGRKIGWSALTASLPDLVVYDVIDGFNFEALYQWQGSWVNIGSLINPSYGGGSNGLGIVENTGFVELRLPLTALGSPAPGSTVRLEMWMTQDGTQKGPLDAMCSDNVQMSRATGTTFDTSDVVQMTCMKSYVIQGVVDNIKPTVSSATAVNFATLANKQVAPTTTKVDVAFSEPVDATTAQNIANYALTNAGAATVSGAVRDAISTNLVHLTLSTGVGASANPVLVTVTNVKDLANNVILANGTTNVGGFFIQNVQFQVNPKVALLKGAFSPADSFWVEGNALPLTFAGADNARAIDANADSVYDSTVPFSLVRNAGTGKGTLDLQYKWYRGNSVVGEFEPRGNRLVTLDSDNGASVVLTDFWNDDNPVDFTTQPMDVTFRVDASPKAPGGGDVITLLGAEPPLSFTQPGLPMNPAGGGIYARTVRFPKYTRKSVRWKVDYNGVFECTGQGDRSFTLNPAVSDTVGGPLGALLLPARKIDRCSVTDKAVAVTFRCDMYVFNPDLTGSDVVNVNTFSTPPTPALVAQMFDDGVSPDLAIDQIFSRTVVFPDSSNLNMEYKYTVNGTFECFGVGNRVVVLDDVNHSVANPIVPPLHQWDYCSDNRVDVPRPAAGPGRIALYQNTPNPATRQGTVIGFELKSAGRVTLSVYNVAGRRIATLSDRSFPAGEHRVAWDGRDDAGRRVPGGVYFYDLVQAGERSAKRMVVLDN